MRALALLLALGLILPVAGCVASSVDRGNFRLEPTRIGWNVTDTAAFLLTLEPSRGVEAPSYTIDPVFAVQSVRLDTGGVGGDHETDRVEDLGLELVDGGATIREKTLTMTNPRVELRLRLPQDLKDDVYKLEITLFKVGTVTSDTFRVNVP